MNENLIVDGNTIYEIDPECIRKKREQKGKMEKEEDKNRTVKGENKRKK